METLDSSNVAITYPHPYVGPDRSNLAASNIETMIWALAVAKYHTLIGSPRVDKASRHFQREANSLFPSWEPLTAQGDLTFPPS